MEEAGRGLGLSLEDAYSQSADRKGSKPSTFLPGSRTPFSGGARMSLHPWPDALWSSGGCSAAVVAGCSLLLLLLGLIVLFPNGRHYVYTICFTTRSAGASSLPQITIAARSRHLYSTPTSAPAPTYALHPPPSPHPPPPPHPPPSLYRSAFACVLSLLGTVRHKCCV